MDQNTMNTSNQRRSGMRMFLIILSTIIVTVGITLIAVKYYFFPSEFRPVKLDTQEEQTLKTKLTTLGSLDNLSKSSDNSSALKPEVYSEQGANRSINLSERELNSLLAQNTDLAKKLAIDLSDNLMSAKLLVSIDPDFPIMAGKIIKVRAGVELAYQDDKPIVILKGVSVMGIPIPNAWLGGLKNIDLVKEFGSDEGFWKAFSNGVENIRIVEGNLQIKLKE